MFNYRNAKKEEYYEFVDLINYVFKVDFEKVLPKTFNKNYGFQDITKVAEDENSKLIAGVCVLPQQITIGENSLNTNFLGGVAVHPRHRGENHMKVLVNMWLDEMKDSCDMSILTGLRQRYEYFGYTPGGIQWEYMLDIHNIKHALKNISSEEITFKPLAETDGGFEFAAKFNNGKEVNVYRDVDSADKIMVSYRQHPFGVFKNGNIIGYLLTSLNREEISEFVLCDYKDTKKVLKAYFEFFKTEKATVILPDYEKELHRELGDFAESYTTGPCCSFNIFNFANVVRAYLELKNKNDKLSYGRLSAVMDNQPITITVDENGVTVENKAVENAVVLDKLEAQNLLLTHAGRYMDVDVPNDWFPLPLFCHRADRF
ncbi:MAG: GNAT family N-acetyltransferase [Ruminococcaceae bacterium]|nr:GNAT family N-acetyltransferase [Oscillospiraceae bacterium]